MLFRSQLAEIGFEKFSAVTTEKRAAFLDSIAEEIMKLGDELLQRASAETALPEARLIGERARTTGQLKMFADLLRDGSWVEATIDRAQPDRKPLPKPDIRKMLIPLGPVVVFGASNFPLAFSVAGGDTASAFAAGNSVVVKAHPAHPGTSEMVARAIQAAIDATQMPPEIFSLVHGTSNESGLQLVKHPATKAVGFTGSLRGGRALFDAAAARPEPIPVFAEMGSTNPVFILPGAVKERGDAIAEGLMQSVTMGVGQFCTSPGLVFGLREKNLDSLVEKTSQLAASSLPGTMLHAGICDNFHKGLAEVRKIPGIRSSAVAQLTQGQASAVVFSTDSKTFLKHDSLREEIFGPSTIIVGCDSPDELEHIARSMPGQLTATIHGTDEDLARHAKLVSILRQKAGRILFNGYPTGLEICPALHHGGPYPATTAAYFTAVGSMAIRRFARPVCLQNFPDAALPVELKNKNARKIWRLVDGQTTKVDL